MIFGWDIHNSLIFRASDIRYTVAQHSKPQIKRSVGFLKKLMHKLEEARELVYKFSDVEAVTADTANEGSVGFGELGDLLFFC